MPCQSRVLVLPKVMPYLFYVTNMPAHVASNKLCF